MVMPAAIVAVFHQPLVQRAIAGAIGAAGADVHVWRGYRSWAEWRTFSWSTASVRWFWGAVTLAASGTAYAYLVS